MRKRRAVRAKVRQSVDRQKGTWLIRLFRAAATHPGVLIMDTQKANRPQTCQGPVAHLRVTGP